MGPIFGVILVMFVLVLFWGVVGITVLSTIGGSIFGEGAAGIFGLAGLIIAVIWLLRG